MRPGSCTDAEASRRETHIHVFHRGAGRVGQTKTHVPSSMFESLATADEPYHTGPSAPGDLQLSVEGQQVRLSQEKPHVGHERKVNLSRKHFIRPAGLVLTEDERTQIGR